jgi:hypothetical protein
MDANTGTQSTSKKFNFAAAVRVIAPVVPLGIALVHGAITHQGTSTHSQIEGQLPLRVPVPALQDCGVKVPCPMAAKDQPVMWWFVFKLNAKSFPACGSGTRSCPFGGTVQTTSAYSKFGQQFVFATSDHDNLEEGTSGCLGDSTTDPVGASFDEIYNGNFFYAIWNDQPYGDPSISECTSNGNCGSPWGHSKGIVAWNTDGEGFVMQVSTPSWPEAGSPKFPRSNDGNTLGCVKDNNVTFSQHFFALRLSRDDLALVLKGLANASVVTDPGNKQVVNNGGPSDIQALVQSLGKKSDSDSLVEGTLSSGVHYISKPSNLHVPPWQLVSAQLNGVSLLTATFWANPKISPTDDGMAPECWDETLGNPGPVQIATSGTWKSTSFDLTGAPGGNHAKIGVSTSGDNPYAIFGDENQQGALSGNCKSSQNGRGGTFYVLTDSELSTDIRSLISGATASAVPSKDSGAADSTNE